MSGLPLRVQVPNNHIPTPNLYYNYCYTKPKYQIIGYMDPLGTMSPGENHGAFAMLPRVITSPSPPPNTEYPPSNKGTTWEVGGGVHIIIIGTPIVYIYRYMNIYIYIYIYIYMCLSLSLSLSLSNNAAFSIMGRGVVRPRINGSRGVLYVRGGWEGLGFNIRMKGLVGRMKK